MKIALLSDCYPPRTGGIESQVGDLAGQLQRAGHEVEVFTATPGAKGERSGAIEMREGVMVHRMALHLPGDLPINPMAPPIVRKRLSGRGFDVAHVHLGVVSPFGWDMVRVATGLQMPTLLTFHSVLDRAAMTFSRALRQWTDHGAILSAVSQFSAKGVRRAAPDVPIAILPNGIDLAQWPVGTVRPHPRPVRVVTATRLAPRKRAGAMLRIVAEAHARLGPGALTLDVFGDGAMRDTLAARAEGMGLGDVVRWGGQVPREELAGHYAEADVYLSPSRLESFGIAALEARTVGLPVIARADSGVSEVVTDGVSGLLASNDSGLADALVRLVADETLRTRIARHNTSVAPMQTWDRVVDLTVAEYRRAGA